MKFIFSLLLLASIFLINVTPLFAQSSAPSPTPQPQVQWMNEFTVDNQPSTIITLLNNFINGFDSFLGGFIFFTPNPLTNPIILKDHTEIPGVTKYRDIFYQITIPVLAIIIAGIAVSKLGSDNAQELKSFAFRLLLVIVLFITVPQVLSYSIQANNLLVEKITTTQKFTGFLNDYFDKSQENIINGDSSETYGIPSFDISLQAGIFKSLGKFIVQIFLFAITFLFLLGGFLYLGFQFIIRFATLLFLGVIYPIVLPFILSEKTENIVHTYFKTWFTFLIQQPAFVLGFAMATDIFTSILNSKGPTVGMLFFYTGFLFFLGGVNTLVAQIFGNAWDAMSNNMQASIAARGVTVPVTSRLNDFKRGFLGGSVSSVMGRNLREKMPSKTNAEYSKSGNTSLDNKNKKSPDRGNGFKYPYNGRSNPSMNGNGVKTRPSVPEFSQKIAQQGMQVQVENSRQGVVSVTGEGYQHSDPKSGLTSIYPNRLQAIEDGVSEANLEKINLNRDQFIDLSSFDKHNVNPHNYNAMQEANGLGKDLDYAYIHASSPPHKIKNFLELSKARNEAYGIKGVIVKRQAIKGSDDVIRIYSPYEKRKNI